MAFRDVIGHRRIVALLARSSARDSLPPSLIFAGPAGVGKRLTALAVAQAGNCLTPVRATFAAGSDPAPGSPAQPAAPARRPEHLLAIDACGTCASCARIARGVHADVLV